jgi:cobalt/nickel transport system ATP-binding protein
VTRPLVAVSDLRHAYADGNVALRGISFAVGDGERLALVGANGAGKSTTLLHLAGCLLPQAGSVRIGDLILCRENLPQVRRSVGLLFQNPDDQLFMPRVFDDVAFGPVNLGLPTDEVAARVMAALAVVGATHLAQRPPHRLSGGEKRAVAIASVLSMSPTVLLMDEPTASLDPVSRRQTHRASAGLRADPHHRHARSRHGSRSLPADAGTRRRNDHRRWCQRSDPAGCGSAGGGASRKAAALAGLPGVQPTIAIERTIAVTVFRSLARTGKDDGKAAGCHRQSHQHRHQPSRVTPSATAAARNS